MDFDAFLGNIEPNFKAYQNNPRQIADLHILIYRFYLTFTEKCDALVLDKKSRCYLESCVRALQGHGVSKSAIKQSASNILKMLDMLNDFCVSIGGGNAVFNPLYEVIRTSTDSLTEDDNTEVEKSGPLDLLMQLKNLLNEPIEDEPPAPVSTDVGALEEDRMSNISERSNSPVEQTPHLHGGVQSMTNYLLSDVGMDNYYCQYNRNFRNIAMTSKMNNMIPKTASLREQRYKGLDNMIAKMKIDVPILNYNIDRVETIYSSKVMENIDVFGGSKSVVTDSILQNNHDFFSIGPFKVYHHNHVFVYECLVNGCTECLTTSHEYLKTHVKFTHGGSEIDWYCTGCDVVHMHSCSQRTLDGALDHLAQFHSVKTTYALSKQRLMDLNKSIFDDNLTSAVCPENKSTEVLTDKNSVLHLFMCTETGCEFSTNSLPTAFGHFSSIKTNPTFTCQCCSFVSCSTYEYCEHLVKEHSIAKYKCGRCPYRSISIVNVVNHHRDAHAGQPTTIYNCEPLDNAEYNYDCRAHNSIQPFVCLPNCNFSTLVQSKFYSHLLEHSGLTVMCHYCHNYETDDVSDLGDHLLLHGVGEYLCIYCSAAFNFISKIEKHLHEKHSSRYPFFVICQDFESRSHSLKGKYSRIQKLDIGDESIIIVPLESDKTVTDVNCINSNVTYVIDDVDYCKAQLKFFLKNTYAEPPGDEVGANEPKTIDTMDLTDEPETQKVAEPVDIKPRLRLRTIAELLETSTGSSDIEPPNATAGTDSFNKTVELPQSGLTQPDNLLTPAQIKSEFGRNIAAAESEPDEEPVPQAPESDVIFPLSIHIKSENAVLLPTSDNMSSPASPEPDIRHSNVSSQIKLEALETREKYPNVPPPTEPSIEADADSNEESDLPVIQSVHSLELPIESNLSDIPTVISELEQSSIENTTNRVDYPILSAETIHDIPIEFDCEIFPQRSSVNSGGSKGTYTEPTIIDTLIISDGEEEDDDCQPTAGPSTFPTTSSTPEAFTISIPDNNTDSSSYTLFSERFTADDSNIKIASTTTLLTKDSEDVDIPQDASTSGLNISTPVQETRVPSAHKYKCSLCKFVSYDRSITHRHLITQHPKDERQRKPTWKNRGGLIQKLNCDIDIQGISCPYCSDRVYETIKGFQKHHNNKHGDFTETKCFIIYPPAVTPLERIFVCSFCSWYCDSEESFCKHCKSEHSARLQQLKSPIKLKPYVALKKMVCPLYNCLEEFFQPSMFKMHLAARHKTVVACKYCTIIADNIASFESFHDDLEPEHRIKHLYYFKNKQQIAKLTDVQRFSNPLYSLNRVILNMIEPTTKKKTSGPWTGLKKNMISKMY